MSGLSGKGGVLTFDGWPPMPISDWRLEAKPEQRCRTQFEFDALYGVKSLKPEAGFMVVMVEDDRTPVEKQRDLWAGIAKARKLWHEACREIGICGAVARAATRGKSRSRRVARLRSKVWARWQV